MPIWNGRPLYLLSRSQHPTDDLISISFQLRFEYPRTCPSMWGTASQGFEDSGGSRARGFLCEAGLGCWTQGGNRTESRECSLVNHDKCQVWTADYNKVHMSRDGLKRWPWSIRSYCLLRVLYDLGILERRWGVTAWQKRSDKACMIYHGLKSNNETWTLMDIGAGIAGAVFFFFKKKGSSRLRRI